MGYCICIGFYWGVTESHSVGGHHFLCNKTYLNMVLSPFAVSSLSHVWPIEHISQYEWKAMYLYYILTKYDILKD